MDLRKDSQFINRKGKISVTILDVISPSDFILKESPSIQMSKEAGRFMCLEEKIKKHYSSLKNQNFYVPEQNEVVVIFMNCNKKFHRARVKYIFATTDGPMCSVFLLDYGILCRVKCNWVFKIQDEFLHVPFQAVHFHLFGIQPLTLRRNPMNLNASYGPADEWDTSAVTYVREMWQGSHGVEIEIVTHDEMQVLHGQLYLLISATFECFNDLLIKHNYAYFNEEAAKKVMPIGDGPEKLFQEMSPTQCSLKVQSDHSEKQTQQELVALWRDCTSKILKVPECLNKLKKDKDNLIAQLSNSLQIEELEPRIVNVNLTESRTSSRCVFNEKEKFKTIENSGNVNSSLKLKTANSANPYVQCVASAKKETFGKTVNNKVRCRNIEEPCPTITKYKPSPLKNLSSMEYKASDCSVTSNLHELTSIKEIPNSSSVQKSISVLKQAYKKAAQNKTESSIGTASSKSVLDKQECQNSAAATPKASSILHEKSKLSNTLVTEKFSEENIMSSDHMRTNSIPGVLKPVNMSLRDIATVRNFFKKFAPKPINTSPAVTNLSSLQTEKNKHDEICDTTSSRDSLLSGVKFLDADKLKTNSQFGRGKKITTSPVHINRSVGRGFPVSANLNEKNSSISTETHHKNSMEPVLHTRSECAAVDIKDKFCPAGMSIESSKRS